MRAVYALEYLTLIRSMTGFGDASADNNEIQFVAEIRSVNNRYYKSSIRLPEVLSALEGELDTLVRKHFTRGSITLIISYKDTGIAAGYEINDAMLKRYIGHLESVKKMTADPKELRLDFGSLLMLPGVIQPPDQSELVTRAKETILNLADTVCEKCQAMRITEGKGLVTDLAKHRHTITEKLKVIEERAPQVVDEYHDRLRARVDELMAKARLQLDETDLIREVALFAEKCDVAEEVQRLNAHLDQLDQILHHNDGEPAGRTLDFLSQEMLREANTIASKSNDVTISRTIVEIKGAIDRIKEQVQNIE